MSVRMTPFNPLKTKPEKYSGCGTINKSRISRFFSKRESNTRDNNCDNLYAYYNATQIHLCIDHVLLAQIEEKDINPSPYEILETAIDFVQPRLHTYFP